MRTHYLVVDGLTVEHFFDEIGATMIRTITPTITVTQITHSLLAVKFDTDAPNFAWLELFSWNVAVVRVTRKRYAEHLERATTNLAANNR